MGVAQQMDQTVAAIVADGYAQLRRFAAVVAPWDMDPDDVLHGALVSVLHRSHVQRLENPTAYMKTAIVNYVHSELRKTRTRRRLTERLRSEQADVGAPAYPSDLADLMNLRPLDRAVLFLHDVEGMPFDEVAAATGISPGHARVTASRARRRLRALLEEEEK